MDEEKNTQNGGTPSPDKKKIKKVEICVFSVLLALILAAVGFIAGWFGRWSALGEKKQSLLWAIDKAQQEYYKEIDEDALYEDLFKVFKFDSYSTYYSKEEYETVAAEREGQNRDSGFSIWQESYLEAYVAEGSSAESAGIENGMHFLKYGKTNEKNKMTEANEAEDYFDFLETLAVNEKYYVQCGESELNADVYEVVNGKNGAGISLTRKSDPMRVYQVVGNSPADLAGLRRGMYILKYGASENKEDMVTGSSYNLRAFVNTLTPNKDGNVTIYLQCSFDKEDADAEVYSVTMKEYNAAYCYYRDNTGTYRFRVEDKQWVLKKMDGEEPLTLPDKTAYIALTEFTGNAAGEFRACLNKMKENGQENLILDLRGNGGGYMDVFVEIAACLLKETTSGTQKVAYAKFRNGATVSYSIKKSSYSDYFNANSRVSVLADEYTASASECLIGALVDYKTIDYSDIYLHEDENGVAKTYGKGIMQTHYEDSNGNTLKLTSAEIFWPKSNKTIHDIGVIPLDGAKAIASSLLPDQDDSFLQEAISLIKEKPIAAPNAPSVSV